MTTQEAMGLKIKSLREEMNISQSTLAEMVGYKDKTAIAKVEAGKVDLPQSKISSFAKALNTTTSYLFGDNDDDQPQTIAAHLDTDDLTEAEFEDVANYIAFLKSKRTK